MSCTLAGLVGPAALSGPDDLVIIIGRPGAELARMPATQQVDAIANTPRVDSSATLYQYGFGMVAVGPGAFADTALISTVSPWCERSSHRATLVSTECPKVGPLAARPAQTCGLEPLRGVHGARAARFRRDLCSAMVFVTRQEREMATAERGDGAEIAVVEGQQAGGTEPSRQDDNRGVCQPELKVGILLV